MEIEYKRKRTLNHRAERAYGYRSNLLMMDIKYDFKANPFKEKDGKPVLYPAVVVKETITTDHIVKELSKHSAYSAGCVVGVLQEVADMVVSHLRQGKNVRLDGLGTFSLALSSREVTDRKEIRAASVRIKKVNFRPVPELVKRVRLDTDILRAEFGFLPTGKKYTKEERWKLLEAYLKEHGSITRLVYSECLGMARTTAAYELKGWYEEKRLDKEDPTRNEMFYDHERALGILIAASSGSDIIKVGHAVESKLEELKTGRLPAGVECHKIFYQPERVGSSLGTFVINLIESVIIVVLILMIAMGFKSGLIIGISLIITVFGSFLFLYSAGGTMQRVSLAAFVLAMGMLVDNAIVIIDGILVDLKAGKKRMEAMTAIGRQTAMPLLGATLIAIIAFLPIYMSPDTAGVYTRDLFIVLAVSLLLSWVLALIHVPLMADRRLHPAIDTDSTGKRVYKGKIYAGLRSALRFGLAHRWSFVFTMIGLLLLSAFGYPYMRQGFFPDMVYDQLYMEYKLPEGNNHTRVAQDLKEIETYLKGRKEITHVTTSIGGTPGRYNLVRSVANPSLSYGELIIDFTSPETLVEHIDEIQAYLSQAYPDAYIKLKRYNLMFKKYPIEAQFLGPDPAVLHQLADSARTIMENTPEVCLITTDWEPQVPVLTIEYDQPSARALGLSRNDVSLSLLTATGGIPIGSFYEGIHKNNIYLKCLDEKGEPIEDLGNAQVFSSLPSLNGLLNEETMVKLKAGTLSKEDLVESIMGSTPLKQISKGIDIRWEDPVVPRYNGQRSQRVQCSPAPGIETEKARLAIAERIEKIQLPEGYSLVWQGEKIASDQSMKYLFQNFPLAIILMIAILIMLFKDYRKPIIIFCCIPMIFVGVVAVMLLTGKVFNFVAIVGTLGLIGMLIKNGIVLMDEITLQISKGIEPVTALIDSSQSRLRPVMMASLTTILGMIPLLSDAMFGSLAAAIMGGLLCSTLITLLFIPILYALFFKIRND